jgi:hypothetical protein
MALVLVAVVRTYTLLLSPQPAHVADSPEMRAPTRSPTRHNVGVVGRKAGADPLAAWGRQLAKERHCPSCDLADSRGQPPNVEDVHGAPAAWGHEEVPRAGAAARPCARLFPGPTVQMHESRSAAARQRDMSHAARAGARAHIPQRHGPRARHPRQQPPAERIARVPCGSVRGGAVGGGAGGRASAQVEQAQLLFKGL